MPGNMDSRSSGYLEKLGRWYTWTKPTNSWASPLEVLFQRQTQRLPCRTIREIRVDFLIQLIIAVSLSKSTKLIRKRGSSAESGVLSKLCGSQRTASIIYLTLCLLTRYSSFMRSYEGFQHECKCSGPTVGDLTTCRSNSFTNDFRANTPIINSPLILFESVNQRIRRFKNE